MAYFGHGKSTKRGDERAKNGGIAKELHLKVLKEHLPTTLDAGSVFATNGRVHTTIIVEECFYEEVSMWCCRTRHIRST